MARRTILTLAAAYGLLLAASHRFPVFQTQPRGTAGQHACTAAVGGPGGSVRIAFDALGSGDARAGVAVVLHGSPGDRRQLLPFARQLARERRVILPDLPGYGESTHDLPDYSFCAEADYVRALLDTGRIGRAHVVAYSMGGGTALTLAARDPARVESLTLVSAVGVQEMELFGSYELNHLVHGLQLAALDAADRLVPHFGLLDRVPVNVAYARTFFDSDQRPLRAALGRLQMPVLILHGANDPLVPVEAAREHARLVPQSRLVVVQGDHFFIDWQPGAAAATVGEFLRAVDEGIATVRATASRPRVRRAGEPFDPARVPPPGPVARVVIAAALAVATLVSEDLACIAAGLLVAEGQLGFAAASAACFAGILIGDLGLFAAGRLGGRRLMRWKPVARVVSSERLETATRWLQARGVWVILCARVVPGMRLPTFVAGGVLGRDTWRFARAFVVASLLWTPLLVGASATASSFGLMLLPRDGVIVAGVLLAALAALFQLAVRLLTYRGRRQLAALWRRVVRWEFWPAAVIYLPVATWIVWLMLRYRSPTVFTAANPGIPTGGFAGESKGAILHALEHGGAPVAAFTILAADAAPDVRALQAARFAESHGMPLVLKPDRGERGSGVRIVRTPEALEGAVRALTVDTVLQEYIDGEEFGLFYARHPNEDRGRVTSITRKVLPVVVGDGVRPLERLILDDERAVALWRVYLAANAARLRDVPAKGVHVQIAEIGNHCRGAIFLNGADLVTPRLERAVDAAAKAMDGFSFGRFDVRAASADALARGDFTILELNGVTSEPTHIYDPSIRVTAAWAALARTWSLAFAIGDAQAGRGARVTPLRELLATVAAHRRTSARSFRPGHTGSLSASTSA